MRKLVYSLVVLLVLTGSAIAANIPKVEDPRNGPGVWTIPVQNKSANVLEVGSLVQWDIASTTGTDDNAINVTASANTSLIAGVVHGTDCQPLSDCTIAIRGVVGVDVTGTVNANDPICPSSTGGLAIQCVGGDTEFQIGVAVSTGTTAEIKAYLKI